MKKFSIFLCLLFLFGLTSLDKSHSQVPQPCVPDCPGDTFTTPTSIMTMYGNCKLIIWYSFRYACSSFYDVQIVMIQKIGEGCDALGSDEQVLKRAYYRLIEANPMGFPPNGSIPDPPGFLCNPQWRISQASCMTSYDIGVAGGTETIIVPCFGADCCLQQMQICRFSDGHIAITPLGNPSPDNNCSDAIPPVPPAPPGSICSPVCNWYLSIESMKEGDFGNNNNTINKIAPSLEISKDILPISIYTRSSTDYTIIISDLYGFTFKEIKGVMNIGMNKFDISLVDLKEGTYVYLISAGGTSLSTGKFIIKK